MVLGLRSSEREKERRRELEIAHLDSHRTPNAFSPFAFDGRPLWVAYVMIK